MLRRSKTLIEIFESRYPLEKCKTHALICCEAIGYLKAMREIYPNATDYEDRIQELVSIAMQAIVES